MDKEKLQNIFTKIEEINPQYNLEKWVYNKAELIRFIDNPSEKVQLLAVDQDGYLIRYIQNPTEDVQLMAVNENPYTIQLIQNPSQRVKQLARSKGVKI
jgi:hypothetical protein